MSQAALYNGGCNLGLLKGASTRMASFFYSIHRCLSQGHALLATIHSNLWESIDFNPGIRAAVVDIRGERNFGKHYISFYNVFGQHCVHFV